MSVKFTDFSGDCIDKLNDIAVAWLEEASGEIESAAKRNSRVKSGETRGSFQHKVIESEHTAYVGSNHENAIWEEFGTGEYALEGNGRKGWKGKKPSRALYRAFKDQEKVLLKGLQEKIKEGMK